MSLAGSSLSQCCQGVHSSHLKCTWILTWPGDSHLPVTRHRTCRQVTTFHPAGAPPLYSFMLSAAFRLVIELSKGNKAASEAEDTMSQLSVGGAPSVRGCHGWTFGVCLHLGVIWWSTGLCGCLIFTLSFLHKPQQTLGVVKGYELTSGSSDKESRSETDCNTMAPLTRNIHYI